MKSFQNSDVNLFFRNTFLKITEYVTSNEISKQRLSRIKNVRLQFFPKNLNSSQPKQYYQTVSNFYCFK